MSVNDGSPGIVESSRFGRYGIAVLSVVVAVAARLAFDRGSGSGQVLFAFTLAIILAARFGGRGPGLLASALCVLLAWYIFLERRFSFGIANPNQVRRSGGPRRHRRGHQSADWRASPSEASRRGSANRQSLPSADGLVRQRLPGAAGFDAPVVCRFRKREKDRQQLVTHSYRVLQAIEP